MNQKGFSLVEIVIAMGLMSVISLGLMRFMENQTKSQVTMEAKAEVTSFLMEFRTYLTKPGVCKESLKGTSLNVDEEGYSDFKEIKNPVGKVKYQAGKRLPGNVIIERMTLSNFVEENESGDIGEMDLTLHFKMPKMAYGNRVVKKSFSIEVMKGSDGNVLNCGPPGMMALSPEISAEEIQKIVSQATGIKADDGDAEEGVTPKTAANDKLDPSKVDFESEEVKKIIENNPYLKELQGAMKSLQENNKAAEEMMKQQLQESDY